LSIANLVIEPVFALKRLMLRTEFIEGSKQKAENRQSTSVPLSTLRLCSLLTAFFFKGDLSMSHYHDEKDMSFFQEMAELSPEEFKAWLNLDRIVGREGGKIPRKYRELIALAVAFTTQCPYCIEVHTKAAKLAGVSREELSETAFLAAALRAGGAATHGAMALKFYEQS
jgi:AhpD family alkylhydroperoxidase